MKGAGDMADIDYKYKISRDNIYSPEEYGENLLYQVGRMHCGSDSIIPKHIQLDYFELTIATDGKGTVVTNDVPVNVSAGDIYISFAGDIHEIVSDSEKPLKFDFITVKSKNTDITACLEEIMARHHEADRRIIRDDLIMQLVSRAINEVKHPKKLSSIALESIISHILVRMIRDLEKTEVSEGRGEESESELLCFRLMNYIDSHIYSLKNLSELAESFNYSYNYLSNLFKDTTGDTLQSYYHNRRLHTASLLLSSGDFSVGDVASMLGYSSVYPFSLAFKKKYGYPPSKSSDRKRLSEK